MALVYETGELIWLSPDPQQPLRYIVGVRQAAGYLTFVLVG